jgi:hypothetical protein
MGTFEDYRSNERHPGIDVPRPMTKHQVLQLLDVILSRCTGNNVHRAGFRIRKRLAV